MTVHKSQFSIPKKSSNSSSEYKFKNKYYVANISQIPKKGSSIKLYVSSDGQNYTSQKTNVKFNNSNENVSLYTSGNYLILQITNTTNDTLRYYYSTNGKTFKKTTLPKGTKYFSGIGKGSIVIQTSKKITFYNCTGTSKLKLGKKIKEYAIKNKKKTGTCIITGTDYRSNTTSFFFYQLISDGSKNYAIPLNSTSNKVKQLPFNPTDLINYAVCFGKGGGVGYQYLDKNGYLYISMDNFKNITKFKCSKLKNKKYANLIASSLLSTGNKSDYSDAVTYMIPKESLYDKIK